MTRKTLKGIWDILVSFVLIIGGGYFAFTNDHKNWAIAVWSVGFLFLVWVLWDLARKMMKHGGRKQVY